MYRKAKTGAIRCGVDALESRVRTSKRWYRRRCGTLGDGVAEELKGRGRTNCMMKERAMLDTVAAVVYGVFVGSVVAFELAL
jgi:hypothetical protein